MRRWVGLLYGMVMIGLVVWAVRAVLREPPPPQVEFVRMKPVAYELRAVVLTSRERDQMLELEMGRVPDASRDLVVLHRPESLWAEKATWSREANSHSLYAGWVENRSPFLYQVAVRGRYLNGEGRPAGVAQVREENIAPGETRGLSFTFPPDAQKLDQVEIRGAGHYTQRNKLVVILLFVLAGCATQVCVAGWLNPAGWERRFLRSLTRYPGG